MNNHEHEFKDVIESLQLLQTVKMDEAFRNRMEKKLRPAKSLSMPFFALRVAIISFAMLLSGTSLIAAAKQSKPGEILYPVKQAADTVTTSLTTQTEISKAPTSQPQKLEQQQFIQQVTPEPTIASFETKEKHKQKENRREENHPATTNQNPAEETTNNTAPTPTPTPVQQSVLPAQAAQEAVEHVLENVPGHVNLPIGGPPEPTPTPKPKNEGSKDNGSNAGAGGSLLPKIKIH